MWEKLMYPKMNALIEPKFASSDCDWIKEASIKINSFGIPWRKGSIQNIAT